jgi:hypothetical protein
MAQALSLGISLTKLKAARIAIRDPGSERVSFDLHADLKEASRDTTRIKVRYALQVETFPMVLRVEMAGVAYLDAALLGKDQSLETLGETFISDLALELYQRNFESLYLFLETLGLPFPSPWLVKEPHLRK